MLPQTLRGLDVAPIVLDIDVTSKKRLLEQVGILFENTHGIARRLVFDSLFARERLGSTGLGDGVAIPHARIKGLRNPLGAFVRLKMGIAFNAPDCRPVNLVFVLLVSEEITEEHLEILATLAHMFTAPNLRKHLAKAPDASTLRRQWERVNEELPRQATKQLQACSNGCYSIGPPEHVLRTTSQAMNTRSTIHRMN